MELKKMAVAGSLESSDVQITLIPNSDKGIEIEIQSIVNTIFGKSIYQTIASVLKEFEVENALVQVNDKGALDHVIRSRMQAVICRSAEINYDWCKED
ncbi:citrate lyase acyl carrier protein [Geosporobacter ferrireducens]|uniref:citrate lyase acyl carrier protein n=1 Tax=Geosporobacter ferrireducens TaxID=1424294 RepID=UPI00139EC98A|nr:citrate lyase acyl carrier protein [Geosporobacter ferrireducens]MTI56603.1 citrate lyase acyl carrier protein [Geosporobacter ferrireducens]